MSTILGKSGTWTITPTNLTVSGTPTYTGTYTRVGDRVIGEITVASTGSTESTYISTYFNLPYAPAGYAIVTALDGQNSASLDNGAISGSYLYPPTWAASNLVILSFSYKTNDAF